MISSRELAGKRKSYKSILSVVKAMKALSAANVRKGGAVLEHTRRYREFIDSVASLAVSLPGIELKKQGARKLFVAFGSQFGLCGSLNERMLAEVKDLGKEPEVAGIIIVGGRLCDRAQALEGRLMGAIDAPGSIEGLDDVVGELLSVVYERYKNGEFDQMHFVFPVFEGEAMDVTRRKSLPPDFQRLEDTGEPPLLYMKPAEIMEGILKEYIYVSLYAAALEAIIAENESRMRTMDVAAKNIEKKIDEVTRSYNYALQEEVTGELLEIIGGYEALSGEKS